MFAKSVTIQKIQSKRSSPEKIKAQIQKTADRILGAGRAEKGWSIANAIVAPSPKVIGDNYQYKFTFHLVKSRGNPSDFDYVVKRIIEPSLNLHKWEIVSTNDEEFAAPMPVIRPVDESPLTYRPIKPDSIESEINVNPAGFFDHFIDREVHIDMIVSSCLTGIQSNFEIRPHILLSGPACSGKTSLMESTINMLGESFCYRIQATSSTQAGVLRDWIDSGNPSPIRYIFIDEIEKIDIDVQFRFLLSVMDERGSIRVVNSRVGVAEVQMPAIVIATCNDLEKVKKAMSGALFSRFSNIIHCPNITHERIKSVILRNTESIDSKPEWVDAALEYCATYDPQADIRKITSMVAMGRERWADGSYAKMLQRVKSK